MPASKNRALTRDRRIAEMLCRAAGLPISMCAPPAALMRDAARGLLLLPTGDVTVSFAGCFRYFRLENMPAKKANR